MDLMNHRLNDREMMSIFSVSQVADYASLNGPFISVQMTKKRLETLHRRLTRKFVQPFNRSRIRRIGLWFYLTLRPDKARLLDDVYEMLESVEEDLEHCQELLETIKEKGLEKPIFFTHWKFFEKQESKNPKGSFTQ